MIGLPEAIRERAFTTPLPEGGQKLTLDTRAVADLAGQFNRYGHEIESLALGLDIHPVRYLRNEASITAADQIRLLNTSVAQVGLGGLGGNLLELFLRTGIGHIRTADGDIFEESNLNRQILASTETLAKPKTDAALARARIVNPSVRLEACNKHLANEAFPSFLKGCTLAVDALGGLTSRLALQRAASDANIPLVTGALAGWTGYIAVVMPGESGPADFMGQNDAAEEQLGCPAPSVAFMASVMATETIRLLIDASSSLAGKILIIDLQTLSFDTMKLQLCQCKTVENYAIIDLIMPILHIIYLKQCSC